MPITCQYIFLFLSIFYSKRAETAYELQFHKTFRPFSIQILQLKPCIALPYLYYTVYIHTLLKL